MKRRISIVIMAVFILSDTSAQVNKYNPVNRAVNNTLMHQALNDFNRSIPLVFFAPGFFLLGNIIYQNNPQFNETSFYENEKIINSSDYYQKEIFDALNSAMIPYIPVDSVMYARFIDKNKLIFELSFKWNEDTLVFTQTNAEKNKIKTVSYSGNKVISTNYSDLLKNNFLSGQLIGDTIRISEWVDKDSGERLKTIMRYKNGILFESTHFEKITGDYRLKSTNRYYQNEENKPSLMISRNRKGKITDSTNYFYNNDRLMIYKSTNSSNSFSIVYTYNGLGDLQSKTVQSWKRNYTITYNSAGPNYMELQIDDLKNTSLRKLYTIKLDINRKLAELEAIGFPIHIQTPETIKRWVFGYNNFGNLNSVKVFDNRGTIVKNIEIVYSYFSPDRQ